MMPTVMHRSSTKPVRLLYVSSIDIRWIHLEWVASRIDAEEFNLSFLLLSLTKKKPALESFLTERGIPFETLSCKLSPWSVIKTVLAVRRHCRARRIDIVHTHIFFASLVGLLGALLAGVPARVTTRLHADMNHGTKLMLLDKLTNLMATRIVATSRLLQRILIKDEGADPKKVSLIHHGLDLESFRSVPREPVEELRRKYNPDRAWPVVGVVARHIELKGIQYVIPAFERLLREYPSARLILAYAMGSYHDTLARLLSRLPPESYCLIEFERNLFALYRLFDIYVHVPIGLGKESFGRTYVEALAAGVPSVFTLSGVAPEFIQHEKNALVVEHENSDQIQTAVRRLIEDETLRESLADAGWRSVKDRFSLDRLVRDLESLYRAELQGSIKSCSEEEAPA